jgi:geranylgeranyl reductase family protein
MVDYDVIIAGGSISGLLAAREIAASGATVLVLEEDAEIGTPEHCGGLVSYKAIENLGVVPDYSAVENDKVSRAEILSPSSRFEIDADKQKVFVLDRRAFDKQIAHQAQKSGAVIRVKCSMRLIAEEDFCYSVTTSEDELKCNYFVDARGVTSIIRKSREGILQSAQYEVYAPWICRDTIEVAFDNERFPGFFAWIIPTREGVGKVGVAGKGINAAKMLEWYLNSKKKNYSIVRKVYAPIWVNGPLESIVLGHTLIVGDAAGQSKPTTAGGIYTCGMGGIFAGKAIAQTIKHNDDTILAQYRKNWQDVFKSEFDKMLLARHLLERLDNKAIDELFSAIPKEKIEQASADGDFDFHSAAIIKILNVKSAARVAKMLLGNELRRLMDS